jgi:adenylate cyclase
MEDILKKAIKVYLGEHILERVTKLGVEAFSLNRETKEVTVISTDILPFKSIGEKATPGDLYQLLDIYLERMFLTIKKYDGKVSNVFGNAMLAYFDSIDHAHKACDCSLEILKVSEEISDDYKKRNDFELTTTIGISTGTVTIGNFGSPDRMIFSLFGDQVNFVQRLQSANEHFKTKILVSDKTKDVVDKDFEFKHVQEIMIKGKTNPVNLYTIK